MTHPTRKPWADRLCAFARVSGPGIGRDGCGVSYYAVELREPVLAHWPWLDDVGRVEARILDHGRPVRLTAPLYAVALAFGLDVRADYAGDCVAELVDVRPVVAWPRPVTHKARPSGLAEAFDRLPIPDVRELVERAARSFRGLVRLDAIATDCIEHAKARGVDGATMAPRLVRAIADALDDVRPVQVSLAGVVLLDVSEDDSEPVAYRWPAAFTGWWHLPRGAVEDGTVLAALAVGLALRGRLPTADEVAALLDDDEPRAAAVEVGR